MDSVALKKETARCLLWLADDEFADAEVDEAEEGVPVLGARPSADGGEQPQQVPAAANDAGERAHVQQENQQSSAKTSPEHDDSGKCCRCLPCTPLGLRTG